MCRVAGAFHCDLGDGIVDEAEIAGSQFTFSRADILLKPMQLRGSGDRSDPRFLSQQPRKRELRRGGLLPCCDLPKYIDQRLVGLPGLRRKTRHNVAEIGAVERRFLGDSARKEALAKRTERAKADAELLQRWQNLLLRLSPPQGILALQSSHGLHGVSTANRLYACFGQAEVLDLAFLDELFDGAGDVFNAHVWIDAVLIKQIDHIGLQPLEHRVGNSPDAFRAAVQGLMRVSIFEAELGCDHDLSPEGRKGRADEFLVHEWTVGLGGVKECDATVECRSDQCDCQLLPRCGTVTKTQSHAAEAESRDFQAALSKCALLHCSSFRNRFSHLQVRVEGCGGGILILPIYCLFLLHC